MKFEIIAEKISEYCNCNSDKEFYDLLTDLQKSIKENHEQLVQNAGSESESSFADDENVLTGLAFALTLQFLNTKKGLPQIAALTISKLAIDRATSIDLQEFIEWAVVLYAGIFKSMDYETDSDIEQFKGKFEKELSYIDEFIQMVGADTDGVSQFFDKLMPTNPENMS